MKADRDLDRIVRSWLRGDGGEDADRVLDLVLDQIDTTPQRRARWLARRFPNMNNIARIAIGAATVVLIVIVGYTLLPGSNDPGGPPASTATPSPTPFDFSAQPGGGADLAPGSYVITAVSPVRSTITVPAGWYKGLIDWALFAADDGPSVFFLTVENLYADPCTANLGLREPAVGPTATDLAAALGELPGLQATTPSDVTLSGFAGKQLDVTVSDTWDGCTTGEPKMWETSGGAYTPFWPDPVMRLWILDVGGTRLVIGILDSEDEHAESAVAQGIVSSVRIEP